MCVTGVMLAACSKAGLVAEGPLSAVPDAAESVSHGMIVLGDRLENPYTTENMRDAYTALYPTKAREEIETSHLYVRFLPADADEFDLLTDSGLDMYVALPILSTYLGHKTIFATEKYVRLTLQLFPYIEEKFHSTVDRIFGKITKEGADDENN